MHRRSHNVISSCSLSIHSSTSTSPVSIVGSSDTSSDSPAVVLYHIAVAVSSAPPDSTLHRVSNRSDVVHSPLTTYHSYVWLFLDTIVPLLGFNISDWSGNQLDHNMFESTLMSQCIVQFVTPNSIVHLLSLPHLLSHLQTLINLHSRDYVCQ